MTATFQTRPPVHPASQWTFPAQQRFSLRNGMTVLGYHLPGKQLIAAELVVDVPMSAEPAGFDGVAQIVARTLDEGTEVRSAEDFAADLERYGASYGANAGYASITTALDVPLSRLTPALGLMAEAVSRPAFPEQEVSRAVKERLDGIPQQLATPAFRASQELRAACFDASSRYARPEHGAADAVERIDRNAVESFYRQHFDPALATLVLVGDLAGDELVDASTAAFGSWEATAPHRIEPEFPVESFGPKTIVVDVPGSVQTQLAIGLPSVDRRDPDWAALSVAAYALGGGLPARLNALLREEKGYTYGVYSRFRPSRRGGQFSISGSVHTEVTAAAVSDLLDVVLRYRAEGMTPAERTAAVDYLVGVTPLQYQSARSVADKGGDLVSNDLPADYVDQLRASMSAVTPESATAAFASRVDPARFVLVAVGDATTIAGPLGDLGLGPVEILPAH